jgi:integrase
MAYAERSKNKLTGRWLCDAEFTHADGSTTRWHKAFATKGEAEGAEAYFRATGEKPPHLVQEPTHAFRIVAERFRARHQEWVAAHHSNDQRLAFAEQHLGAYDIKAVRTAVLEKYVDTVKKHCGFAGRDVSNRTIRQYLFAVSKVLSYALKLELIAGVPAMPEVTDSGASRDAVSWQLENAVCAWIMTKGGYEPTRADRLVFSLRVLAATGMRCGEFFHLRPEDIETPEQIEHTGIQLRKERTKTNTARWVPIQPQAAVKLRAIIARGELPNRAQLYDALKRALEALGENKTYTLHCLRHSTITRLYESGAQHLDVALIVGHSSRTVTARYYHPSKAHLFAVAEKVQNGLGEIPKTAEVVAIDEFKKSA